MANRDDGYVFDVDHQGYNQMAEGLVQINIPPKQQMDYVRVVDSAPDLDANFICKLHVILERYVVNVCSPNSYLRLEI